jgi:hypothetical protein
MRIAMTTALRMITGNNRTIFSGGSPLSKSSCSSKTRLARSTAPVERSWSGVLRTAEADPAYRDGVARALRPSVLQTVLAIATTSPSRHRCQPAVTDGRPGAGPHPARDRDRFDNRVARSPQNAKQPMASQERGVDSVLERAGNRPRPVGLLIANIRAKRE